MVIKVAKPAKNMKPVLFRHRLEYAALLGIAPLIRALPRQAALRLGRRIGSLSRWFLAERRKLAEDNVRQAFPDRSPQQVAALVKRNFEQLGMCAVDSLRLDLFSVDKPEEYFELRGVEHLREAQALGRGVILLTGHLGFWEAGNYVFPALGVPLDTIAKPLKNRLTDAYFYRIRTCFGAGIINSRKGARQILKSLQSGRAIGLLLDQHISPPGSVQVDFFGRKAYVTTAITNMAMKYGIPIVPTFCLRRPDNRYDLWIEPPLLLEGGGEDALIENTQHLTNIIEQAIRRDPGQWFWMHKRWRKTRVKK
jgi:KDO2-lipid IV(A) lauroyltransferase